MLLLHFATATEWIGSRLHDALQAATDSTVSVFRNRRAVETLFVAAAFYAIALAPILIGHLITLRRPESVADAVVAD